MLTSASTFLAVPLGTGQSPSEAMIAARITSAGRAKSAAAAARTVFCAGRRATAPNDTANAATAERKTMISSQAIAW